MSNAVFPAAVRGLTFAVSKSFEFSTIVQTAPNQATTRISQVRNPVWHWTLLYEFLKDNPKDLASTLTYTDLQTMLGFLMARAGQADDFLFTDPDDNYVGPALTTVSPPVPNLQAQLQVVNDGAGNYYSPIQRNMGGLFYEDITDLNGSIAVYSNGVLKSLGTDYTVGGPGLALPGSSFMGMYLAWAPQSPPATPPLPITAQFHYYFRVRVESDRQDFDKFMNMLWTMGGPDASGSSGLKLVSSRTTAI